MPGRLLLNILANKVKRSDSLRSQASQLSDASDSTKNGSINAAKKVSFNRNVRVKPIRAQGKNKKVRVRGHNGNGERKGEVVAVYTAPEQSPFWFNVHREETPSDSSRSTDEGRGSNSALRDDWDDDSDGNMNDYAYHNGAQLHPSQKCSEPPRVRRNLVRNIVEKFNEEAKRRQYGKGRDVQSRSVSPSGGHYSYQRSTSPVLIEATPDNAPNNLRPFSYTQPPPKLAYSQRSKSDYDILRKSPQNGTNDIIYAQVVVNGQNGKGQSANKTTVHTRVPKINGAQSTEKLENLRNGYDTLERHNKNFSKSLGYLNSTTRENGYNGASRDKYLRSQSEDRESSYESAWNAELDASERRLLSLSNGGGMHGSSPGYEHREVQKWEENEDTPTMKKHAKKEIVHEVKMSHSKSGDVRNGSRERTRSPAINGGSTIRRESPHDNHRSYTNGTSSNYHHYSDVQKSHATRETTSKNSNRSTPVERPNNTYYFGQHERKDKTKVPPMYSRNPDDDRYSHASSGGDTAEYWHNSKHQSELLSSRLVKNLNAKVQNGNGLDHDVEADGGYGSDERRYTPGSPQDTSLEHDSLNLHSPNEMVIRETIPMNTLPLRPGEYVVSSGEVRHRSEEKTRREEQMQETVTKRTTRPSTSNREKSNERKAIKEKGERLINIEIGKENDVQRNHWNRRRGETGAFPEDAEERMETSESDDSPRRQASSSEEETPVDEVDQGPRGGEAIVSAHVNTPQSLVRQMDKRLISYENSQVHNERSRQSSSQRNTSASTASNGGKMWFHRTGNDRNSDTSEVNNNDWKQNSSSTLSRLEVRKNRMNEENRRSATVDRRRRNDHSHFSEEDLAHMHHAHYPNNNYKSAPLLTNGNVYNHDIRIQVNDQDVTDHHYRSRDLTPDGVGRSSSFNSRVGSYHSENESVHSGSSNNSRSKSKAKRVNFKPKMTRSSSSQNGLSYSRGLSPHRSPSTAGSVHSDGSDGSHGSSQRSVILHAPAVADIPPPRQIRYRSRPSSADSVISSGGGKETKTVNRSFSLLSPWKPKKYKEKYENTNSYRRASDENRSVEDLTIVGKQQRNNDKKPPIPKSALRSGSTNRLDAYGVEGSRTNLHVQESNSQNSSSEKLDSLSPLPSDVPHRPPRAKRKLANGTLEHNHHRRSGATVTRSQSMPKDSRFAGFFRRKKDVK